MCGICGKFNFAERDPVDRETLVDMTDVLVHRGPDGRGMYFGRGIGLGHRRLSIIDLSERGRQPMFNEDNSIALVFNGEIYNYLELSSMLRAKGHSFRSQSDTEVIIHAYEEYGAGCVERFNGMFAFALWDSSREELLLARDRLGIKPLYYHLGNGSVTFASEIKSLLADRAVPAVVDAQALSNFLTLHYVPGPRTMFSGIRKLQPGCTLTIGRTAQSPRRYWEPLKNPPGATFGQSEQEAADALYGGLRESVRKRMQSDVPVGALLSGGLDSSAILGLMTGIKGSPVPSFTVGYSPGGDDPVSEFKHSRAAAAHFASPNHEAVVTAQTFLDFLPRAVWHQDEPIGEPASIPLYFASRLAKDNGVTVLLTGEGSDELFAGYNRHWGETLSGYYSMLPGFVRDGVAGRLIGMLPRSPLIKKGHRAMSKGDFRERYMSWHTVFTDELKQSLLRTERPLASVFDDVFEARYEKAAGLDGLDRILLLDLGVWLPDDLLMKKDKMGMAASIEARVPFLDYTFVEDALRLPHGLKVRRLVTKYILKKSMERLLPKRIIYRRKEGFPTPISGWLRGELKDFMLDTLCSEGALSHGLFDRKTVAGLVSSHIRGAEDNGRMIFPLINFELWHSIFITGGRRFQTTRREVRNMAFNT